jgi:rhodanese-related sulfurtransferase
MASAGLSSGPMAIKRVTPDEARELLDEGWIYVDVRSIPEFEQGHPAGAYNVPLMHAEPGRGMIPNPEFVSVIERAFDKADKLVLGCRSGQRSLRAAEQLAQLGFTNLVDMRGGFGGEVDRATGQTTCEGWQARGLPVETAARGGRDYESLQG